MEGGGRKSERYEPGYASAYPGQDQLCDLGTHWDWSPSALLNRSGMEICRVEGKKIVKGCVCVVVVGGWLCGRVGTSERGPPLRDEIMGMQRRRAGTLVESFDSFDVAIHFLVGM